MKLSVENIKNPKEIYEMIFNEETKTVEKKTPEVFLGYQCDVKFAEFQDFIPFMASETDVEEHGRYIFNQIKNNLI